MEIAFSITFHSSNVSRSWFDVIMSECTNNFNGLP